jgi:hypothetical protein
MFGGLGVWPEALAVVKKAEVMQKIRTSRDDIEKELFLFMSGPGQGEFIGM